MIHDRASCTMRGRRRGSAMVLVLVAMAMAFVLGLTFLSRAGSVTTAAQTLSHHAQARQIAESGLAMSVSYLEQEWDWRRHRSTGAWIDEMTLGGGTVTVEADFTADPKNPLVLTATGRHGDASHVAQVVVGEHLHAMGAAVSSRVALSNIGGIDSFDSSIGAYGGANIGSHANVSTNATAADSVSIVNNAKIYGDVYVGMGALPEFVVSDPAKVTGDERSMLHEIEFPPPATPPDLPSQGGQVIDSDQTIDADVDGDARYSTLEITNNATLRIDGDVTLVVDGDFDMDSGGKVVVSDGSSLHLYVGGTVEFSNDTRGNVVSADPSRFIIFGFGDGYLHRVHNSAHVYAILDAPTSALEISNNAHFYGTIMVDELFVVNTGDLHLDVNPAVLRANPRLPGTVSEGGDGPRIVQWREP